MTTLATYQERRFDGYRSFELFEDKVVVKGKKSLGAQFESTIVLDTLQPYPSIIKSRSKGFGEGIAMTIISLVLLQSGAVAPLSYWGGMAICGAISGVLLTLSTSKRVEWAYFSSKAGVVTLTIARAGKEENKYQSFITILADRIAVCGHGN